MANHSHSPAFTPHDHHACSARALKVADQQTMERGLRMTPVRRRVLEILLESHRALGAYEVLERLSDEGFGRQPPVAYRALDFLVEHGFAHRIQRLNAFVACTHADPGHRPAFFICSNCDALAEVQVPDAVAALNQAASQMAFSIERVNLEILGLCPECREAT